VARRPSDQPHHGPVLFPAIEMSPAAIGPRSAISLYTASMYFFRGASRPAQPSTWASIRHRMNGKRSIGRRHAACPQYSNSSRLSCVIRSSSEVWYAP